MAKNQLDPNDRLELVGFDYVVCKDSSFETVDGANLNLIGSILANGSPLLTTLLGYLHTQATPSDTWIINHNLGYKPNVQVFNAGSVAVLTEVENSTVNQTIVRIAPAQTGFARLA